MNNNENISFENENIFFNCVLKKKIIVESKYLNENINEYILNKLKNKVESLCIDEGYVKKDSIVILKKSIGKLYGSKFTGDISYEIAYTADVCNPVVGNIINCKVKFLNKLGILGNNGPITIIIGKQFHLDNQKFKNIKENDTIKVEVIAKKFSLNDKEIKVVAKLWSENNEQNEITQSDLTLISADDNDNPTNTNNDFDNIGYDEEVLDDMNLSQSLDQSIDEFEEDEEEEDDNLKIEDPELELDGDSEISVDENDDYEEDSDIDLED